MRAPDIEKNGGPKYDGSQQVLLRLSQPWNDVGNNLIEDRGCGQQNSSIACHLHRAMHVYRILGVQMLLGISMSQSQCHELLTQIRPKMSYLEGGEEELPRRQLQEANALAGHRRFQKHDQLL